MQYMLMFYQPAAEFEQRDDASSQAYRASWVAYADAVRQSGVALGGLVSRRIAHAAAAAAVAVKTGLISTPPLVAQGARAAHSSAASRSGTSTTK